MLVKLFQTLLGFLAFSLGYAQTTTLTFYRAGDEFNNAYLVPLIAAFEEAHPDIEIASVVDYGSYDNIVQKALLDAAAGNSPDLVQIGNALTRTVVENANPVPLDEFIASDPEFNRENLFPAMLRVGQLDGQQYAIPLAVSTPVLYYNKAAFRDAGLDPERPPRTWDEVVAAAEQLEAAGYEGVFWESNEWIFQAMVESEGGAFGEMQGDTYAATLSSEPAVAAAAFLDRLVETGLMPYAQSETRVQLFSSGRLGMLVSSTSIRAALERDATFEVAAAPMPTATGDKPALPAGGTSVIMLAQDPERQQAAWTFLKFLTEPEASRIVAENSGYTPANREVIAALAEERADEANYQVIIGQAPNVTAWHSWPGRNSTRINARVAETLDAIMLQRQEPEAALSELTAEVNNLLTE